MSTNHNIDGSSAVTINAGLADHQTKQREESLQKVKDTLTFMRENGLVINYKSLSEESGVSRTTLYKPHIQEYLMQQKEFNRNLIPFDELLAESELKELAQYKLENQKLKSAIVTLTDKIQRLESQLEQEKSKRKAEKIQQMEKRGLFIVEQLHNRIV